MKKLSHSSVIFCLCIWALSLHAQDNEVIIKIDTLSKDVYMLTGQGGNIGIYVGKEYVFMIDDQFDRLNKKIKAAIATLSDKPIAFLFNTHMHGDHTGGNASFNNSNTTIVAHDNVRKRVMDREKKKLEEQKITASFYQAMLPEVTFSNDITFFEGEETIMAFHEHNAHTDGDALVYFLSNNVMHMGDTYFSGRYPYIDLSSGGSVEGLIKTHKKALLVINDDTVIIPGHGRPSNKKELQTYVAMLEDIMGKVKKAISEGATLDEVKADPAIAASYDDAYGGGFIKPDRIRAIFYNSLSKK
ncbi:MAG: MBL fold metallo-hydrolase [Eudoraea sp.]|nr:MBL fold metallo-hydrolase [Eudoraea sp.]